MTWNLQTKWSEEDEKMLTDISWAIRHCAYDDKKKERVMKWFNDDYRKSLRPSWKPSEEQMYALGTVVKGAGDISVGSVGYNLKKLYEQLKKLGVEEGPEYYQHFDPDC